MSKKKVFWITAGVVLVAAIALTVTLVLVLDKEDDHSESNEFEKKIPAWSYECINNACRKVRLTEENLSKATSMSVCRLHCSKESIGTLWPKPTGQIKSQAQVTPINPDSITFATPPPSDQEAYSYFVVTRERFLSELRAFNKNIEKSGAKLVIRTTMKSLDLSLTYETDESYSLKVHKINENEIEAIVAGENYYGIRNGLESLMQLIVFDDIHYQLMISSSIEFDDKPVFKHRGIHMDTSRTYFPVEVIKRQINALAMVKMNTFHWHITDSHSFPIVLKNLPEISRIGAYSPEKVYTEADVREIVRFGRIRGVRVIPEFDQPAHVGEGFQDTGLTACVNFEPWYKYCVEPPCGQFDPTKPALYDMLEKIYTDYVDYFHPLDTIFHMGGDEVSPACWNSSAEIVEWMKANGYEELRDEDYYELWGVFQLKALERWDKVAKYKTPLILWTSHLTESPYLEKYLDPERYVIHVWDDSSSPMISNLISKGYRLIFSNVDALYFDCGFGGWVTEGHNWCSPYKQWQKVYSNNFREIVGNENAHLVLGAEAALWTEQTDENTVDGRYWPRVSALAERLWTDPQETTFKDAESRFIYHRTRLVRNGLKAELIQPQWCLQNGEQCPYPED